MTRQIRQRTRQIRLFMNDVNPMTLIIIKRLQRSDGLIMNTQRVRSNQTKSTIQPSTTIRVPSQHLNSSNFRHILIRIITGWANSNVVKLTVRTSSADKPELTHNPISHNLRVNLLAKARRI